MLRCKLSMLVLGCGLWSSVAAQELFIYTEPSSNMPSHSIGIRLSNWLMDEEHTSRTNYHFIPEIMWGVNKNLMIHLEGFFSNTTGSFVTEGGGLYVKYRFYSKDKINNHFRMAAFGRASTNNGRIHQETITTNGHNTGYQLGIIATQLLHKTAVSATAYYEKAYDNFRNNELPAVMSNQAVNYSLSAGRLILPKSYTGYKQTNMNIMVEVLGQSLPDNGKHFIDIAPAIQFIFNSQTRLDIGYKHQLYSNMTRTAPNGFLIRIEHLLFNVI